MFVADSFPDPEREEKQEEGLTTTRDAADSGKRSKGLTGGRKSLPMLLPPSGERYPFRGTRLPVATRSRRHDAVLLSWQRATGATPAV
jgi:hypothetical protein